MKRNYKRRSNVKAAKLLKNITTIHGLTNLHSKNNCFSMSWSLILIGNIFFTTYLMFVIKTRFQRNQIYTTIDATCTVDKVNFPSVSICNANHVSYRESRNIEKILKHYGRTEDEINKFFAALSVLVKHEYFSVERMDIDGYQRILNILQYHYFKLDTIMEEVRQTCDKMMVYCVLNRKVKNCNDIFKMIKTSEGHCCTFNYAALNDFKENSLLFDKDDNVDEQQGVVVTSESGRQSGLSVLIDVEPEDYPAWSTAFFRGAMVLVFDPDDFPEQTYYRKLVNIGESLDLKVQPMIIQSEEVLRRVDPKDRGCWFDDESRLAHSNHYSYETCRTECRMRNYIRLCGCLPYKYPRENRTKICDFTDIPCVKNLTVSASYRDGCNCYFECVDKNYIVTNDMMPFIKHDYPNYIIEGLNKSSLLSVKVYYERTKCNCYTKNMFMDFNNLIESYGGIICLTMGGSIIAAIEIVYLLMSYTVATIIKTFINKI